MVSVVCLCARPSGAAIADGCCKPRLHQLVIDHISEQVLTTSANSVSYPADVNEFAKPPPATPCGDQRPMKPLSAAFSTALQGTTARYTVTP